MMQTSSVKIEVSPTTIVKKLFNPNLNPNQSLLQKSLSPSLLLRKLNLNPNLNLNLNPLQSLNQNPSQSLNLSQSR